MSVITKPRRRWTDGAIETELRAQCAELGHFPVRAELVERGLRGLWDAMRSSGGVEVWRERVGTARGLASRDEIAVRAYELYEDGVPGDAVSHWLTAERQLTPDQQ
jgi:hypothetical protein